MLAGIGFTVSLFIAELAFTEEILRDEAKIGIFAGSAIAGVVAVFVLRSTKSVEERYRRTRETSAAGTGE
jgi:Na+/H+ antiporter NhaA